MKSVWNRYEASTYRYHTDEIGMKLNTDIIPISYRYHTDIILDYSRHTVLNEYEDESSYRLNRYVIPIKSVWKYIQYEISMKSHHRCGICRIPGMRLHRYEIGMKSVWRLPSYRLNRYVIGMRQHDSHHNGVNTGFIPISYWINLVWGTGSYQINPVWNRYEISMESVWTYIPPRGM